MKTEKLKKDYEKTCMNYIKFFEKKHDFDFYGWIDGIGNNVDFYGDYVFHFSDIKHDIDNNIEKGKILEWHDYCLELHYKKAQNDDFEDLIQTIERNSKNNKLILSPVDLWAQSWREERKINKEFNKGFINYQSYLMGAR